MPSSSLRKRASAFVQRFKSGSDSEERGSRIDRRACHTHVLYKVIIKTTDHFNKRGKPKNKEMNIFELSLYIQRVENAQQVWQMCAISTIGASVKFNGPMKKGYAEVYLDGFPVSGAPLTCSMSLCQ